MTEKHNASQLPRVFYARHMQPGICKYEDEVVLVDTNALKNMIGTGIGIPVYVNHQPVDLAKIKEQANGYITESFYNELDGWAWFKFLAIDDEIHNCIKKGWSVSNAYRPEQFGGGGTKNNCAYHREVLNANFTHLAIVANPRYEDACIMTPEEFKNYQENNKKRLAELQNSKPDLKGKTMLKLFKNKKEEVTTVDMDTMIDRENGKSITIGEMLNAVEEAEAEKANAGQMVKCNGEEIPLKELVNRYENVMKKNKKVKKNEEEEEVENDTAEEEEEAEVLDNKKTKKNKKVKKNEDADDMENSGESAEEKAAHETAEAEDKKNSQHFDELRNAHEKTMKSTPTVEAPQNRSQRGQQRYGSPAKA